MKLLKIFILFLTATQVHGQVIEDCKINSSIISNNGCSIRFNQLVDNEIGKYKKYCSSVKSFNSTEYIYLEDDVAIENHLFKSYPLNFKKIKTGFEFKNKQGKILKIQRVNLNSDSKQYQDYDFIARVNHFIIISQTGYESWNYLLIDLNHFDSYNLPGEPIFIGSNFIYGYSNYYGSGELTIINIKRKNDVTLSFENEIIDAKYSNNLSMGILLEFRNENCSSKQFLNLVL